MKQALEPMLGGRNSTPKALTSCVVMRDHQYKIDMGIQLRTRAYGLGLSGCSHTVNATDFTQGRLGLE